MLSPSVWHLQHKVTRRTITSHFQPHCFPFTRVSVSKVRATNFNFYLFIFQTICNPVTSFHFSVSFWLNLLSHFYLHTLPLHYCTGFTDIHFNEGLIHILFSSFRFKTQWHSRFGLAATYIWKHHNALSLICYVTQSTVKSELKFYICIFYVQNLYLISNSRIFVNTSCYSTVHAVHKVNVQLHYHSDKSELLSILIILNPQYICPNCVKWPFRYYFVIGDLVIQVFR